MTITARHIAALLGGTAAVLPQAVLAQDARYTFDLAEQDLGSALMAVAAKAGWQVYVPSEAIAGLRSPALRGTMTVEQATISLLAGLGLKASFANRTILIQQRDGAELGVEGDASIVVTGSLIRGAEVAAPVIRLSRDLIVAAGQTDTGEAVRALPQNFSGGQNPGVGTGAGLINTNVNSAASANLRGLGPDATLKGRAWLQVAVFIQTGFWPERRVTSQATASSPLRWIIESNLSAGPPGRFFPRSQSDTRFFETLR